ncbi:YihY/virulence factor BrkB family protein [Agromyces aurantiacus]|uniref:YihY/virulence factor BrkB family protein n=1 Tax=Agromyces aurantiacus TaxID=165814 RepID=A0ABV9RAI7_9MICO|nr:YihY/virulence factor BrkB family protein [Agromyces aurantiacus]MBM7504557.1 membrane protein [Agromyces aurantiacus]
MSEHTEGAAPAPGGLRARVKRLTEWALSTKPVRAFLLYQEQHGAMLADSVTYRTLFSVFAGTFLGFAIAGIWLAGNPEAIDAIVATVSAVIPGLVGDGAVIDPADLVQPITLSIAGAIALVGTVGAAIGAIGSLRTALRSLAGVPDDTTFFIWQLLRDLAIAIAFGVLLVAGAAITVIGTGALGIALGWIGLSSAGAFVEGGSETLSIVVAFVIDTVVIAGLFRLLSGLRPSARALWSGAVLGGLGLTVLQVLSGLFVGGATSNPLLASFGSLVALLIWLNLSSQVVLIASAYVITGVEEERDRVAARYGATSMAARRLKRAERRAADAAAEVAAARDALPGAGDPAARRRDAS